MTNSELYALRNDATFLQRVEVGVVRFALYLRALGASASQAQQDWTRSVLELQSSAQIAQACAWEVAANAAITGPDVVDATLNPVVELCCTKYGPAAIQ
jgi:hypothetical protein